MDDTLEVLRHVLPLVVGGKVRKLRGEFTILDHLLDGVQSTDEFAFDEQLKARADDQERMESVVRSHLWIRVPVGVNLQLFAYMWVGENVEVRVLDLLLVKNMAGLPAEAAARIFRRALHEENDGR